VSDDALVHDRDRCLSCLAAGHVGGDRESGVVVDELEDHALAAPSEDVLGGVELPARVRGGIDETAPRRSRLLLRFEARDPVARKIRASVATEGTGVMPRASILSWTLTGPWSRPEDSSAVRTPSAWAATSSLMRVGEVRGRLDRGSSAAACPSSATLARIA